MAVPKQETPRSSTGHRRSRWRAEARGLVPITIDARRILVPRRLVRAAHRGLPRPDEYWEVP